MAAWCLAAAQPDRATQQRQERLAKHASMFPAWEVLRPPLEQWRPNAKGEIDLSIGVHIDSAGFPAELSAEQRFAIQVKVADVIVEGTMEQRFCALTARRSFVFSDWELRVAKVFKNTSSVPAVPGDLITVVQPGGELMVGGRRVFAHLGELPEFALGQRYLLYLAALPDSQSFKLGSGSYLLGAAGPRYISPHGDADPKLKAFCESLSYSDFVAAIERSIPR